MYPQAAHAPAEISTVSDPPKHTNYFARHWRGEISLPISFWVNGLCGYIIFGLVILGISYIVRLAEVNIVAIAVVLAMFVIIRVAFYTWQLVGIWRSATSYTERTGRRFWVVAAKRVLRAEWQPI
jgi:hypothetical protein